MGPPRSSSEALSATHATARAAFRSSSAVRIGAEIEWLVFHDDDLSRPVAADVTAAAADGTLPAAGVVSIEPGGQLELSTQPFGSPEQLVDAIALDAEVLVDRFRGRGLMMVNLGLDPIRPPRRTLQVARYEAMEAYFAARSPAGLRMMSSTAAVQLNIDFGGDPGSTWRRAQAIAPVLLALFANSPTADGHTFEPSSARQRVWADTDPSRSRPVTGGPAAWVDYVLDAQVMLRRTGLAFEPQLDDLSLRAWLDSPAPPSASDVADHITTLFPPLRPRGFLEFRMLDALPAVGRAAAITAVWALMTDEIAGRAAEDRADSITDAWDRALQHGLADPEIRRTATTFLDLATQFAERAHPSLAPALHRWQSETSPGFERPGDVEQLVTGLVEK